MAATDENADSAVNASQRVCGVDYPRDKVIVHQIEMGRFVPSLGHFVMKLETYLRVAGIPYEPNYDGLPAPKGKIPWIEYNGKVLADSQFIIAYLNKEFNVDLDKSLSAEDKNTAWAIQKWYEESTYWFSVVLRWLYYYQEMKETRGDLPDWLLAKISSLCDGQGVSRHSPDEVEDMFMFDVDVLSSLLGDKKYLMGGSKPTTYDCALFGQLVQFMYHMPPSLKSSKHIATLTNLREYVERIKDEYWPDWNDRTSEGLKNNVQL